MSACDYTIIAMVLFMVLEAMIIVAQRLRISEDDRYIQRLQSNCRNKHGYPFIVDSDIDGDEHTRT